MSTYVLAIDQGTTSSRAILFDGQGGIVTSHQKELTQYFPADGWVEHDANEIWQDTVECCKAAIEKAGISASDVTAIGITNQRETTVIWDRATGEPIAKAIVWQDRRTAPICAKLTDAGLTEHVRQTTGLVIDAYFSGTKIAWLLDNVAGARAAAERGELAFGTIDCFLLWRLTGGAVHAADATNAARTMIFDIGKQAWDETLLDALNIPASLLPNVVDSSGLIGTATADLLGAPIPITGVAGDQQAATVGQACFQPGMLKSTYGTGCFALLNTGSTQVPSANKLLTTIAYRMNGETCYAIEGSIFNAGTAVQWVRDGLNAINDARETKAIAESIPDTGGTYLVPAFTGLGAPHWDPDARGAITGITRDTGLPQIVRAALESVAYQTHDLMTAMGDDVAQSGAGFSQGTLRVDGGMVVNDWVCQFLADILNQPVERPKIVETTALGAAYLAGLAANTFHSLDSIEQAWQCDQRFEPKMNTAKRQELIDGWQAAVARVVNKNYG